jgi:serine/threonine protein kinase
MMLQDQGFAIKRLFSPNKEDFKREVEMLKMFSNDSHRHLISLLATYEYLKVYYLIFPWADSDLNEYWSKIKPTPVMDFETIWWVANQCEGIADGLRKVHRYKTSNLSAQDVSRTKRYGRHGDLKPDNVLWFSGEGGGILKISDFGLSEFSTVHSKSYKPRSRVATSAGYRPPECDIEGGLIGQSYDIWTLGCLYLEFITWLLGGWELLQEFRMKRTKVDPKWYGIETDTFFELGKSSERNTMGPINARVKPAVTTVIKLFLLQFAMLKLMCFSVHAATP